ncbi:hypothetical protein BD289DRAFT_368796 [Coniella lustricola]|uniref:Cyclin-D1-binding protein 1-like N-terminal domain-containing protein n=1 Tax=Coniella lustricola TaxID=2025994 RepID=A0A2T3A7K0_9PEZI|nr:hypothetical protein BD289DRAFT_368796 [Coniella lustricola]
MAPPKASFAAANEGLKTITNTTLGIIENVETVVTGFYQPDSATGSCTKPPTVTETAEGSEQKQLDALVLARDAATLIKAHSTKISLFIINEPFTPSAISTVLRQLLEGPIPALASAVEQCRANIYTQLVQRDLAWKCARLLKELREFISRIPQDGKVLPQNQRTGTPGAAKADKGSIVATGVLWGLCDEIVGFCNLGVAGYLVHKAENFRDTLKDVLDELKEWYEEQDEQDDDDDEAAGSDEDGDAEVEHSDGGEGPADDASNAHTATQAMLDSFMDSQQQIPRGDPQKIRPRLDSTLRRLRLTVLLFSALIKRRLKTLPKLPLRSETDSTAVSRVDEVMPLLRSLTDRFNSLAVAFYELDSAEINRYMDECFFDAFAVAELLAKPWEGQKDEFTDWVAKFRMEIRKD